jgi:Putative restriction endonuclease
MRCARDGVPPHQYWRILAPGTIRTLLELVVAVGAWLIAQTAGSGDSTVSTIITGPPTIGSESPWPLHRMSFDQYEAMVASGIFTERDRLQLINGMLVAKVTQVDDHCVADDLCGVALSALLSPGWFVRPKKPIALPPDGAPEPDDAVVRGSIRDYGRGKRGMPRAGDVALVVEREKDTHCRRRTLRQAAA